MGNVSPRCGPALEGAWWAPGLTLAERLRLDPPPADVAERAPSPRDLRRLERWRSSVDLVREAGARRDAHAGDGVFARLLADLDLDEAGLLALLGEAPADIARRGTPPWWARFTTEVLAATPTDPPPLTSEVTWHDGFAAVVAPFVAVATDQLCRAIAPSAAPARADLAVVRAQFRGHLSQILVRLAARTLVLELNVARVTGRLAGATPTERFASFVQRCRRRDGLAGLLREYVVLCRLLCQACRNAIEAYQELIRRLAADRSRLVTELLDGAEPGPLAAIDPRGDQHRGGRVVAVLRFAGGAQVVYKPRPLAVYRHFAEMLRWLNGQVPGLDLRAVRVLDRDEYGWAEYVPQQPCATPEEVARFYRRLGGLMALLYATDSTDMHCENLVACGEQPMLVDLETLFHPPVPPPGPDRQDPAFDCLESSVYRCVILPRLLIGEHGAVDMSGIGGDSASPHPLETVAWAAGATDHMRLVRAPAEFPGAQNRPRLADADADPAGYVEVLLAGFRSAYDTIAVHRKAFMQILSQCDRDETRLVVRPTHLYSRMLDETTHPDVMRDALDRDHVLATLWREAAGDTLRERLVPQEIADLWAGDVPYFSGQPASADAWTGGGRRLPALFPEPSLRRLARKLDRMGELDRHDQEWIIQAALATRQQPPAHQPATGTARRPPAVPADPHRLRAAALGVADLLLACACRDGERVNWLGVAALADQYWTVQPLDAGLANGYCGVALFLAQICALTGIERYGDCALRAISRVPTLLATLTDHPDQAAAVGCGGFAGLGGLAYGLTRIASLLQVPAVLQWAGQAVELSGAVVDQADQGDIVEGLAGGLAAMIAVHEMAGMPEAWGVAVRCADRLRGWAGAGLTAAGFGYGGPGLAWALTRFAAAGGGVRYLQLGRALLERERRRWSGAPQPHWSGAPGPESPTHASALTQPDAGALPAGWCQGLAGITLAEAAIAGLDRDERDGHRSAWLDRAIALLASAPPLANDSLCHGELGNLEPFLAAPVSHAPARVAATSRAAQVLESIEMYGPRCATPGAVTSPGLLTGLAGIGYGLLRAAFADRVPSVLLLAADQGNRR